ncbi:tetratricopeptide repeat protein [Phenylobacterium sp. LjRoot219]|uniref:tetratricopeptide repeat protein n=1 Tax=Phenylobacterium sp. LjRoot219 TaxID=3342283 RepID=UPI003ECC205A
MRRLTACLAAGFVAGAATAALGGAALAAGSGMDSAPSASAQRYDTAAEYARGVGALAAGQYKDAARAFKRVTGVTPDNAEAWRLLGQASAGDGDWKGARRAYAQAVKLAPDDIAAHGGLGVAEAQMKDPAGAQAQLDWLKAKSQACGAACADATALKAAEDQVQGALSGQPAAKPSAARQEPLIFAGAAAGDRAYATAVGLINERRYDDALAELKQAQAMFGPHPDILTYQGYAWRRKGDLARAEAYYRQALAVAPDHRGASEYYGELKVERGDVAGAKLLLARLDAVCAYGCAEAEELRRWIDHGGDPQLR